MLARNVEPDRPWATINTILCFLSRALSVGSTGAHGIVVIGSVNENNLFEAPSRSWLRTMCWCTDISRKAKNKPNETAERTNKEPKPNLIFAHLAIVVDNTDNWTSLNVSPQLQKKLRNTGLNQSTYVLVSLHIIEIKYRIVNVSNLHRST